jgi:hypothetical protein
VIIARKERQPPLRSVIVRAGALGSTHGPYPSVASSAKCARAASFDDRWLWSSEAGPFSGPNGREVVELSNPVLDHPLGPLHPPEGKRGLWGATVATGLGSTRAP